MDESSTIHGSNISLKLAIIFGIIGLILIVLLIFYFFKIKNKDHNHDNRSKSSSIESFQQLYFTKIPYDNIKNFKQYSIERWSSVDQPSMTFYRASMQNNFDNIYRPVTEQNLRLSIEQSKAMEYIGHEIIFF